MPRNNRQTALKYAKGLLAMSQKEGVAGKAQNDLTSIVYSFKLNDKPWKILRNPFIDVKEKMNALKAAFEDKVEAPTLKILEILTAKRQLALLPLIEERFHALADEAAGIVRASVKSAYPLSGKEKEALEKKLAAFFGQKVVLESKEDPSLIAGIMIKAGDYILEQSVRLALRRLKNSLANPQILKATA
ncbi:MAG: ATP synthase F1 subunit delta [Elusimicrobia bacterium]|nr:ATP synthase F1 subunit delta [Elusimicrobiota bacterium]